MNSHQTKRRPQGRRNQDGRGFDQLRSSAEDALQKVLSKQEALDTFLEGRMKPEQRAWLKHIALGTLRHWGFLKAWILSKVETERPPRDRTLRLIALALFHVLENEDDDSKTAKKVSEWVSFIKARASEGEGRFANALLRQALREKEAKEGEGWKGLVLSQAQPWQPLSSPKWLFETLSKEKGEEWATRYLRSGLTEADSWIRVEGSPEATLDSWSTPVDSLRRTRRVTGSGALSQQPGFEKVLVQDVSNQRLLEEALEQLELSENLTALDWCAAPGGKSIALAWEGWNVDAMDISSGRLNRMRENVHRVGANSVEFVDFEKRSELGRYGLVWVDAPCSSLGLIRRHPDVKWTKNQRAIRSLANLQLELLTEAAQHVDAAGALLFSVCSVLGAETEQLVQRASSKLEGFELKWTRLFGVDDEPSGDGIYGALWIKKP
jgi:16S rRNA (cytosine967-C5)-methyltransferase